MKDRLPSPAHPTDTTGNLQSYFRLLERRFQVGLLLAFLIPFALLSAYFHFQFHVTLKETGKLNLAAIAESQRNTVDLFLQERVVNIFSLFRSTAFSLTPEQPLTVRNFHVLDTDSGEDAIKIVRHDHPEVVILDQRMPGMDGQETLEALKKAHPWMEIVILTGHGTIDSAAACTRSGAYSYLQKPCEFDRLLDTLVQAYRQRVMNKQKIAEQKMNQLLRISLGSSPKEILRRLREIDNGA